MAGEVGNPIRDPSGKIIGYTLSPTTINPYNPGGLSVTTKQKLPDLVQQYNQQNFVNAMRGSSGIATNPQSLISPNPNAYASNTLGSIQQQSLERNDNLNLYKNKVPEYTKYNQSPQQIVLPGNYIYKPLQTSGEDSPTWSEEEGKFIKKKARVSTIGDFRRNRKPIKKQKKKEKKHAELKFWGI
jgi:hypothetical protein